MMREGPISSVNYDALKSFQQLERGVSVSANYTAVNKVDFILVDSTSGVITITLPLARSGARFTVIRTAGANNVNVVPSGTDTINGGASVAISASYTPYTFKDFTPLTTGYVRIA